MILMTKQLVTLANGDQVAYWTHHDGKKPTLVLVHGFTGSHEGFQYLVPLLEDFHLVIPDLPGFGESPLPHDKLTLRELGSLLVDFVEELNLHRPILVGHSMGSLVVAEAVRHSPATFSDKLVLASPVPSSVGLADIRKIGNIFSQLYYSASHRLPVLGKHLATSTKLTRFSTALIMTAKDKALRKAIHGHHFRNLEFISSIGWYSRLYREINRTGINRYRSALVPFDILVISGDKDAVTPIKHQRKSASKIGANLSVIPKVGHLAHYEKPRDMARAIISFLR